MLRRISLVLALCCTLALWISLSAFGQEKGKGKVKEGGTRPPLFFRLDWQEVKGEPAEHPIDQRAISNPNLELKHYGPSGKEIQENGVVDSPTNPMHVWTGLCDKPCGLALRDKNNFVDLTGLAKINWYIKTSGLHQIHPLLKLADGRWIIGERGDGSVFDYQAAGLTFSEQRWMLMDIEKMVTRGRWLQNVDLSKVDEIGFTDLLPGSGHGDGGYTDLAWWEVYGKAVPR